MSINFKAKVNNSFDFDLNAVDISNMDALQISETEYHILHNNQSFKAEIINQDFNNKSYQIKINNNNYNVTILNDLDILIKEMGFTTSSTKHVNSIKAPMPGLILEVDIKIGQDIKENDTLLILEAMKMENIITSPRDGIIKSIAIKKGDAVEKNQLLIEFE
ncbi:MAG: acetyl-CoA carboxylase biotin carboxyl carrier protein subunit [Flaviramulus sp.]|nr:acetyl-CoA carboxylase biotin carboxyl carrier protein subunit [Flaviramulus sp.]